MTIDAVPTLLPSSTLGRARIVTRGIAVQGVAGAVAGIVVGGVGGRIVMRLSALAAGEEVVGVITENGNRVGTISLDGTIALMVFGGALFGALAAILVVVLRPWLRWAGRWQGLAIGVALLGIAGATLIEADNRDFLILDPAWLNVVMFGALILAYGWMAVALADWWLRRNAEPASPVFHLAAIVIGAPLTIPLLGTFVSEEFCTCRDPMVAVGVVLVAIGLLTAGVVAGQVAGRHDLARRLQPIGLGLVALAFVLGTARLVSEITTIV